ncbi:MAG TPA: MBL fold metallo-hydrolase [Herpetosiphonaceae bacterium]
MSLQVRSLASGSSGNAFLVRTTAGAFLIDAGLSARTLERVLRQHNVEPSTLTAIVLSHEHHDHAQGAGPLARRYNVPIVCTSGTAQALGAAVQGVDLRALHADGISVGDADVWSFALPHDAAEPVGVLLRHQEWTIGIALDFGHTQPHIVAALQEANLVVIEANHDRERLLATAYPWSTKHRILGEYGHLSNLQAAQLIEAIVQDGRRRDVWLGHLSERANDRPRGVIQFVRNYLDMLDVPPLTLSIAQRDKPSATWHSDLALQQGELFQIC